MIKQITSAFYLTEKEISKINTEYLLILEENKKNIILEVISLLIILKEIRINTFLDIKNGSITYDDLSAEIGISNILINNTLKRSMLWFNYLMSQENDFENFDLKNHPSLERNEILKFHANLIKI